MTTRRDLTPDPDAADLNVEAAKFGAMLARKGLSPEQVATLMRDQVQPVLADAVRQVEGGADIDAIEFGIRYPGQAQR